MRVGRWILLGALAVACLDCASVPKTHYYVLEWPSGAARPADGFSAATRIGVKPFAVDPPYDQDRIVYRVGSDSVEIGFYSYHRWAVPLSRMLPTLVARALEQTSGVASVEASRPGGAYDLLVEGRLAKLEEIDSATGPRVRAELVLSWHDGEGNLLGTRTATADTAADTKEVAVVVARMADSVAQAIAEALAELP